jgi:hypothetical protein
MNSTHQRAPQPVASFLFSSEVNPVSAEHSGKTTRSVGLRRGQPFNPYRMFTGIFIPEELVRSTRIRAGAKLAWSRLARYAGAKGWCIRSKNRVSQSEVAR